MWEVSKSTQENVFLLYVFAPKTQGYPAVDNYRKKPDTI